MSKARISGVEDTVAMNSAGTSTPESLPLDPGLIGGRYEVLGLLGSGGMGTVYRVRDTELEEVVALKMLRREVVSTDGMLARFRQEVKLARRVTSVHVARTFDIGEHEGERFLTMEYIEGESLAVLLGREGALPISQVVDIASTLCEALEVAHASNVVHRDLKPDNILLATGGRVVITDFGIARAVSSMLGDHGDKPLGALVGTPAYMAPEQVETSEQADHRADLYALGAVLYELITGERAWAGEDPFAVAAARLVLSPPDPRVRRVNVPSALADATLRLMARRPADRFQTAREAGDVFLAMRAGLTPTTLFLTTGLQRAMPAHAPIGRKSVAVLPFTNLGAPEDAYVADGLTDDLIDVLSMTRGLRVRPRGAVNNLDARSGDVRDIGRLLDVHVVVDGSVRKHGELYRLTVRAISTADGFQLWAKRFDRPSNDLLVVSDEVAHAIAAALAEDLESPERATAHDPLAVELYLRARAKLSAGWYARASLSQASALLEQAAARAPDDPAILAAHATAETRHAFLTGSLVGTRRAVALAERATVAVPRAAEAWLALASARHYVNDGAGALRALVTALHAAPSLGRAHDLAGRILIETARTEDAAQHLETSLLLDPTNTEPRWELARARGLRREWAALDAELVEDIARRPVDFMRATLVARLVLWAKADGYAMEAWDDTEYPGQTEPLVYLGVQRAIARSGSVAEEQLAAVLAILAHVEPGTRLRHVLLQFVTEFFLALGALDEAFSYLLQAVSAGLADVTWMDGCALLRPLREREDWVELRGTVSARADVIAAVWPSRS